MKRFLASSWNLIVIFGLLWLSLRVYSCWPNRPIPHNFGDGDFIDLSTEIWSWGIRQFTFRQYGIVMPSFDLDEDFSAKYNVGRLPNLGSKCIVYLSVDDPELTFHHGRSEGVLSIEIENSRGVVVSGSNASLWKYTAATGAARRGTRVQKLYLQTCTAEFYPNKDDSYVIHLSYQGDASLASFKGCCYLQCGYGPY